MNKKLDPFEESSRSGVPDEVISERSGVSTTSVAQWRRAKGIKKPRGYAGGAQGQRYALQLLGDSFEVPHAVKNTFGGNWKVPEYLLRVPLSYTAFCRLVHGLELSAAEVAEAIGVKEQDVLDARATWRRYLSIKGHVCKKCEKLVDPKHRC